MRITNAEKLEMDCQQLIGQFKRGQSILNRLHKIRQKKRGDDKLKRKDIV